jgi:hypothetical protein
MTAQLTSCAPEGNGRAASLFVAPEQTVITVEGDFSLPKAPEGMEFVTRRGHTAMFADLMTGHFAIADLRNGRMWYDVPVDREEDESPAVMRNLLSSALVVSDYDPVTKSVKSRNSFIACERRDGIAVTVTDRGLDVLYTFVNEGYVIPVSYILTDDGVRAEIQTDGIRETGEVRILTAALLPMMGAQNRSAEGFLLMAGGSGSRINFNNGKAANSPLYRVKVYGEDISYVLRQKYNRQETYSLPVFGISAGDGGLLAIADAGAAEAFANAAVSGQQTGYNNAWFDFQIRGLQAATIGDITSGSSIEVFVFEDGAIPVGSVGVRFILLNGGESDLGGLAAATRGYLTACMGMTRELPEKAPIYLSVLGAFR